MSFRVFRITGFLVVAAFAVFVLGGCGTSATLPATVLIELPDGTVTEAGEGAGVGSLANTTWIFFRVISPTSRQQFLTISFGRNGNLEGFSDNTIAPEIFGADVYFDGEMHPTTLDGVTYAASTYGAETADGNGFAFAGRMTAWFGPVVVGEATANATGNFDTLDPDTMTGTFAFTTELNFFEIPEAELDEEFPFIAHRLIEGDN